MNNKGYLLNSNNEKCYLDYPNIKTELVTVSLGANGTGLLYNGKSDTRCILEVIFGGTSRNANGYAHAYGYNNNIYIKVKTYGDGYLSAGNYQFLVFYIDI